YLEAQHARLEIRFDRVARQIAGLVPGDQRLDLVDTLLASSIEPLALGLRGRNPRQLADRAERELAARERVLDRRQLLDRERDAHPLHRGVRLVAEVPFHVVEQADAAELAPQLQAIRFAQPLRFLGIERRASP